jgi:hypothetical protein
MGNFLNATKILAPQPHWRFCSAFGRGVIMHPGNQGYPEFWSDFGDLLTIISNKGLTED